MVRPTLKKQIPNLQEAIKDTAWKQIAEYGAAALSLRAIARELKITAPAIYNYFPDRDALVTALIYDAYVTFGDAQLEAREAISESDLVGRLLATGRAYRGWALKYPQRFRLIFGTPIPGYSAPYEKTFPVAARSLGVLVQVVEALRAAGRLKVSFDDVTLSPEEKMKFEYWKQYGIQTESVSFFSAVWIWMRVHGLVTLEVDGGAPPFGPSAEQYYERELEAITQQFVKG
jgi:AcrR family transcriptional regulator